MMNRNEMEELLPDYAFGRLPKEKENEFKENLENFPDLQQEIEEINLVFSKIDKMNFDDILESKTRNLSVKVNNRRMERMPALSGNAFLLRFAIPAAVVIFILITIFKTTTDNQETLSFSQKLNSLMEFDDLDKESINDYDYYGVYAESANNQSTESVVNQIVSQLNYHDIEEKKYILNQVGATIVTPEYYMIDDFEFLSEDDFQNILEEIKNVKI
ncbi:MAG: hypothetical protein KIT33_11355 [Candidatus Kapabacteria bacterium]|nr:hypothetical protein [Ignavibacteriota bacterium]MCW5885555.1 hypothetical protein [Candidatus Kapabacteria bacterium]